MAANVITEDMAQAVRDQLARRRTPCGRCAFGHAVIFDPEPLCPACADSREQALASRRGFTSTEIDF
jgi:hypothetical protein